MMGDLLLIASITIGVCGGIALAGWGLFYQYEDFSILGGTYIPRRVKDWEGFGLLSPGALYLLHKIPLAPYIAQIFLAPFAIVRIAEWFGRFLERIDKEYRRRNDRS